MGDVYTYLRVSSRGQIDGDGPERQRDAIAAFCKAYGLKPVGEFFERGIRGDTEGMDRPAFSDMVERTIHLAKNGAPIEAIVVERMDRLARDLMVSELLLGECRKHGLKVYAADQGNLIDMAGDGGDPTRVLIRQIMAALAQWEKAALVKKLRLARERIARATGKVCGQTPHFGTFPGEKQVMDYILSLWNVTPRPTYRALEKQLRDAGIVNRSGGLWSAPQLHGLLTRYFRRQN